MVFQAKVKSKVKSKVKPLKLADDQAVLPDAEFLKILTIFTMKVIRIWILFLFPKSDERCVQRMLSLQPQK